MKIDWQKPESPFSQSWAAAYSGMIAAYNTVHVDISVADGLACVEITARVPAIALSALEPSIAITTQIPAIAIEEISCPVS